MSNLNFLFIMPDQLRPDFLSCYGADFIKTPNIDSIANQGVLYENAYSTSPVCVAARHNLLTGLNSIRTGVLGNGQFLRPDYSDCGIHTWPGIMRLAGYRSAAIGKMHFYPWDVSMGFDDRVICEDKRWLHIKDDYSDYLDQRGLRKLHGNEHPGYYENKGAIIHQHSFSDSWDYFVGSEAANYIRSYEDSRPFAMMVGLPGPHCPYDPSPEYADRFSPEDMPKAIPEVPGDHPILTSQNVEGNKQPWNGVDYTEFTEQQKAKVRAHYAGLVKQIDDIVGDILKALKDQGQLDKTVIIFSSDHGDYLGDHNLIGKGHFFESSCHVPLIVRLPDGEKKSTNTDLVALADITPTMLNLAGVSPPGYMDFQPLPGLGIETGKRDYLYGMMGGGWMCFDGRWKLCKYRTGEHLLFDLYADPMEQNNLLKKNDSDWIYQRLDFVLTTEIMRSVEASHRDNVVYDSDLSGDFGFGEKGWERLYPASLLN
ncbi:MAG: sulfatase-like hydrolase/transferase [Candidatus Latescibacterota bacterium]|nr:sulfatase-like hydrolase/transferase [Candidatus Latescibacterota bacterium]